MLRVESLRAWYGFTQALFDVSFDVDEGETVALVGTNGAGKTTILRAISGLLRTEGTILLAGRHLDQLPAHARFRDRGLGLVPEGRGLFPDMTVRENLTVGLGREALQDLPMIFDLFPVIAERINNRASLLSGGQQQMVAVARAVLRRPRVLMLDEPSLGLAPVAVEEVYRLLRQLRDAQHTTTILVEQSVPLARLLADRLLLVRIGQIDGSADARDEAAVTAIIKGAFGDQEQPPNGLPAGATSPVKDPIPIAGNTESTATPS